MIFWYTGAAVWYGFGALICTAFLWLLYRSIKATVDVLSQLLVLHVEKSKRNHDVSLWLVWCCSFDDARWAVILYRIRRCIKGNDNVRHPYK